MQQPPLTWKKRHEFTLSIVGYVVGIGNLLFFPRLAYKNGGVVFFIPYLIVVVFVGLPMMMLEISLGQFCSRGVTKCWGFSRLFSGIGISMVITSALVAVYYNMAVAWAIYYFGASFDFYNQPGGVLPWANCDSDWISTFSICRLNMSFSGNRSDCEALGYFTTRSDGVCYQDNETTIPYGYYDLSLATNTNEALRPIIPVEDYFRVAVNKKASSPDGVGELNPMLIVCLAVAWTLVFACVCKGIKSIGKVVYVTATVPYIIMLLMIFYGAATLEHSSDCLAEFMKPRFDKLSEMEVWQDAAIQGMFSLGISAGSLITLSAYNDFSNNTFSSTLIVVAIDTVTSIISTIVVFMYLGVMSHDANLNSCESFKDDGHLAFHVFPYAVTTLPVAPVWSVLFFFMVIMMGLDTMIAEVETVVGSIIETWKPTLGNKVTQVHFCACIVFWLSGFIFTSSTGLYWYEMFSTYVFSWNKLVTVILIAVSLSWVYGSLRPFTVRGADRVRKDIEVMIGPGTCCSWKKIGGLLEPFWRFIIPLGVTVLLVFRLYTWEFLGVWWLDMQGWFITVGSLLPIVIVPIVLIARSPEETLAEKIRAVVKPTYKWGPTLVSDREKIDYVPDCVVRPSDYVPGCVVDPSKVEMDIWRHEPQGEVSQACCHDSLVSTV